MKGELDIDNTYSREAWLLIVLIGVFVYQVLTARYFYWYDIIFTSIACLVAGIAFLFLFNMADGRRTKLNVGSALRIVAYVAAILVGAYLVIPIAMYFGLQLISMIVYVPFEMIFLLGIVLIAMLLVIINWGAKNLYEMAKNYTVDHKYEEQDPAPKPD